MSWKHLSVSFALAVLLLLISCHFLDRRLTMLISEWVGPKILHSSQVSRAPDVLFEIVCAVTVLSWAGHFCIRRGASARWQERPNFFELVGSTAPLSYLLKDVMKTVFGRTNTRFWLQNPGIHDGFHWFQGGGDYNGFPSGHMVVFTALMLAIYRFYPRFRYPCLVFLSLLAAALIITQYHFLSDVIAGAYLGLLIDLLTYGSLSLLHRHRTGNGAR